MGGGGGGEGVMEGYLGVGSTIVALQHKQVLLQALQPASGDGTWGAGVGGLGGFGGRGRGDPIRL